MLATELVIVSALRALVEVAGLFLLGQGVLYVVAGAGRERNVIYRLFRFLTRPVVRIVRLVTPKVIVDRHVPAVSFFLLFWLWIFLALARRFMCAGLNCG